VLHATTADARHAHLLCQYRDREVRQLPREGHAFGVHRDRLAVVEARAEVFLRLTGIGPGALAAF
jgi:hypothetical protein